MNKTEELLDPPRWPGGTPICTYENLMAFDSKKALDIYRETSCPSVTVGETWQCGKCGLWHFTSTAMPPSGVSSGNARKSNVPVPRYKRKNSC